MPSLAGLHDAESIAIAPPDTWAIDTIALSENPEPVTYPSGVNWIVRANHGYGSTGTLPVPDAYEWFAAKVAAYVSGTRNCSRWIIGNEPNLPREWPANQPILPLDYVDCFKLCHDAIHALPGHASDEVLVAASGPWNAELSYIGNPDGDWIMYFADVLRLLHGNFDGYALHAYTHGYDVSLVTSEARMDAPFQDRYYNFRTYQDYCDGIPPEYAHLPAYITEANGNGPWECVGLIPAMLGEIDAWNNSNNTPLIHCVAFFRWPHYDQFYIEGRSDVVAEYEAAVRLGYQSPEPSSIPEPPPFEPEPDERSIDPVLLARGVEFDFVSPPAGTGYWRITFAEHLNEAEADNVGPDHHILGEVTDHGDKVDGVPIKVTWPSGSTTIHSKPQQAAITYNYDFPMSSSLNEFSICVDDGAPSDKAMGIGMGAHGNPSLHTSTWIDFEWVIAERPTPPDPKPPIRPPVFAPLLWPVEGPISQYFGATGIDYSRWGLHAHDGLDFAVPTCTDVVAVADGIVMWVDDDPGGFGLYIRIWHAEHGFHSLVAHLSAQLVKVGQVVERGQVIAKSGNTGNSTGAHVHYSCRLGERNAYYNLHDGFDKGCANPLAVHALVNRRDPNMSGRNVKGETKWTDFTLGIIFAVLFVVLVLAGLSTTFVELLLPAGVIFIGVGVMTGR